jgi:outer membrane cobalamin receptor
LKYIGLITPLSRFVKSQFLKFIVSWLCTHSLISHSNDVLPSIEVIGHYDNSVGSSEAASQGVIGADLIKSRAQLRPGEILEYIPGMVVTQHSGDGKANQYFLRGVNLDHGTDFATTVNGVPVNMSSHAHGQGYSDLNFLIPELVQRVEYKKGPYFASNGDFSSAGSANMIYRTKLDRPFADFTLGQRGYLRGVAASSQEVSEGVTLLSAVERLNNNGPWTVPEGIRKSNAQFILSSGSAREGWTTSFSAYAARWNSTDQVPQRLIDAGQLPSGQSFGRFDSLDSTDGAKTSRMSLSGTWHKQSEHMRSKFNWYAISYDFDLFSNFTYLTGPTNSPNGDQFEQKDKRTVLGGSALRSWFNTSDAGLIMVNTLGVQVRQDQIRLGLYDTASRQIQTIVRDDKVKQSIIGVFGENEITWNAWLKSVAGIRADHFNASVTSYSQSLNSGTTSSAKLSPKTSLIFGPWHKTEFFINAGRGFHSNDARGTTAKVDPKTGVTLETAPGLVSSRGQEIGLKTQAIQNLQTTIALWQLDFDSELVYSGDTGSTEAGRPSKRNGVELSNHWTPSDHYLIDANLAWTRPRYSDSDSSGNYIPNAVQKVASVSFAIKNMGPWSASLSMRFIGAAPLIENNSVQSPSSLTSNLRINRKLSSDVDVTLDVLNLTDRKNNDVSYYYTSRVAGESLAGVSGVHVHPAEPRTIRLNGRMRF